MISPRLLVASLLLLSLSVLGAWLWPLPPRMLGQDSAVVLYRDGSAAHVFLSGDQKWRIPATRADVDPDYLRALFALEDERFPWHMGVDPIAVGRAVASNVSRGRVVSGASTLTMQLARMLEPRPRVLTSKAIEATRALQLEIRLGKEAILEQYLSYLPFGRNVEGIEAASFWYFGHSAKDLSRAEVATLLAVPQDPNRRFPSPENEARLTAARAEILYRLEAAGVYAPSTDPLPPVPARIQTIPRLAPHAALWMHRKLPGLSRLRSTLDGGLQRRVEKVLERVRAERAAEGIHNVAVVVVDHKSAELRALAGNFDFWDREHGGQILSFDEPRSPGSTLKPFVYAAAIDRGIALPGFLVPDAPVHFGSYSPENYDGTWSGMVSLEESLSRSLNVPFIHLLQQVGVEPFLGMLRKGGVKHLNGNPGYYGLSLVAGGVELTPLELAGLYTALAEDGHYRPLRWQANSEEMEGTPVLSPGAAWLTRRALRLRDRPDFPTRAAVAMPAGIHWKTGTSFGNRDAWAVGSGERYTVVVWLGNLDNSSSSHLIGSEVAAPLLFDLLDGLDDRVRSEDPAPAELVPVRVCALSGHPPSTACGEQRTALARVEKVPTEACPYHKNVEIDVRGFRVHPACRQGPSRVESRVAWPATVKAWLGSRFSSESEVPPWAIGCEAPAGRPSIRSPSPGMVLSLIPGMPADDQEVPLESVGGDAPYTWFVDGKMWGQGNGERLWWIPAAGVHQIMVMDGGGGTATVTVEVRQE